MSIKALIIALAFLPSSLLAAADAESPITLWRQSLERRDAVSHLSNTTASSNFTAPVNGTLVTSGAVQQAEILLSKIVAQQSAYNTYRVANPRLNTYTSKSPQGKISRRDPDDAPKAPVLNETILAAAALIAERDAVAQLTNGTLRTRSQLRKREHRESKRAASYWVSELSGNGLAPMNSNPSYQVYRDVTDPKFGAKGDGVTDDTAAINAAIAFGNNCGSNCLSSSIKGTLIYFPPGTYLISSPINAYYYSQLVGDANDRPTIKTSASFVGLGAIQTDVYNPGGSGGEWYIEQSNFYRQVRNFKIDITGTTTASVAGLHWQVAQATSLTNVYITASTQSGDSNTQMGMFTENGSGGFMSDVVINGGAYGIYGGNQQYTVRDFIIWNQVKACICVIWDWGWTWSGLNLAGAPIGISLLNPQGTSGSVPGSTYILDSEFTNLGVGVYGQFNQSSVNSTSITFDNIAVNNVGSMLEYSSGATVDIPKGDIDFIIVGELIHAGATLDGSFSYSAPIRPQGLVSSATIVQNQYFTRSRPQYETLSTDSIISVKSLGAYGDGIHDDTAAVQKALNQATVNNLIYFPAGSYLISQTLFVWPFTRMTGEVWSQLVATGSTFANITSPQPMLRVGYPGNVGTVEISDMLFTSTGALPGLVLVEWNVQAQSQGSVGIWDSHFRLGGAYGTGLQVGQCPYQGALKSQCIAAAMMLHITPEANGYFENMWAWVADHDIDDPQNTMISVQTARGILIEAAGPTWLYGTASEHAMLYQYNFANATNTFAGMIQTESPYFQGVSTGTSPGIWAYNIGQFSQDPVFNDPTCNGTALQCEFAWALMMQSSTNLTIASAGLYSWFADYGQSCVDSQNCQQRVAFDDGNNDGLSLWNLITIGSVEMVSAPEYNTAISAKEFTQASGHPYWSTIAGYLEEAEQVIFSCGDNDTRSWCQEESPCDLTQSFASFATLQSYADSTYNASVANLCVDYLAMDTLYNVLNATIASYPAVNDGYDAVFGYYQEYMRELIPTTITNLMEPATPANPTYGSGLQFFQCACTHGCSDTSYKACPINIGNVALSNTITYKLIDETGYNNTLAANGLDPSWVYLGTNEIKTQTGCQHGSNYCVITDVKYVGIPKGTGNYAITNPKNYVSQAIDNGPAMMDNILAAIVDLNMGQWNGSSDDLLQIYSTPVFLLQQAIASMAQAKALGQQQQKEDKIKLITEILSGILAALPLVAEVLPAAYAGIAAALNFAALAGGTALTIESVVTDPGDALDTILALVGGAGFAGGAADGEAVAAGAATRRALADSGELGKIGHTFEEDDTAFQAAIRNRCEL